jgi:hypothetical protein
MAVAAEQKSGLEVRREKIDNDNYYQQRRFTTGNPCRAKVRFPRRL